LQLHNETVHDVNHASPDEVVYALKVENLSVEEALLKTLPKEGENADKKKRGLVYFEEMIDVDEYESGRWLQASESVYGFCVLAFVQVGVATYIGDFVGNVLVTFISCLVIGFVQGYSEANNRAASFGGHR